MKEPKAHVRINVSIGKPGRFEFNPSAPKDLQRRVLRDALCLVADLCHYTRVDFCSLLTKEEREKMSVQLAEFVDPAAANVGGQERTPCAAGEGTTPFVDEVR